MTEPMAASPAPAPEKAGLFEDFIDIFFAPAKVFARRATAGAFLPWLIVSVFLCGLAFAGKNAMEPVFEQEIGRQMQVQIKANPQLAQPEAADRVKSMMMVSFKWGSILASPIILLCLALLVWAAGKGFGGTLTYGTALMITSYAWVPRILAAVISLVQLQFVDVNKLSGIAALSFGPARFLDPDKLSSGLMQLALRADLFVLWTTVLVVIGLIHAGKVTKEKAMMAGVTLYVLGALPALWAIIKGT